MEIVIDYAMRRETIILMRAFEQMPEALQQSFLDLVQDVAG